MEYNLKLQSDIFMMSNEFSNKFTNKQYYGNTNSAIRMDSHKSISEYQSGLKSSLVIEDCGELNQHNFYNIMSNNAPYIAQRILERKINQTENLNENQEIIDYFRKTEIFLDKKTESKTNIDNNNINENNKKIKKKNS